MEKTVSQVEKNVSASFGYVKKDMLMLNDAFSDLHEKVQHLSMNHAALLEEIAHLRFELERITGKKVAKKTAKKKVAKKSKAKKSAAKKKTSKKTSKKSAPKVKKVVTETTTYE